MDKSCKQYIKNVKSLFPILGKEERTYINKLQLNIEDYCSDHPATSLEELYAEFDSPENVISNYFTRAGMDYLTKRIRRKKVIQYFLIGLVILILIAAIALSLNLYFVYNIFDSYRGFFDNVKIEFFQ